MKDSGQKKRPKADSAGQKAPREPKGVETTIKGGPIDRLDDPFAEFSEWESDADRRGYDGKL